MYLFLCFFLSNSESLEQSIDLLRKSDRVLLLSQTASERLGPIGNVPPGLAPVLGFRYLEGSRRHGFGDLDLVVDDAGH